MAKRTRKPTRKKRTRRTDRLVVLSLIFLFPFGLFLMWSERCKWPRALKTGVSVSIAAVLILILSPLTQPPSAPKNGVRIVSNAAANEQEKYGPDPDPEFEEFEVYVPYDNIDYNIVVAPTEAPEVTYVYCNDAGSYYHTAECRYKKRTTPKVTLTQALNAGYKRCIECDAPEEPAP